eukprot:gene22776-28938_t
MEELFVSERNTRKSFVDTSNNESKYFSREKDITEGDAQLRALPADRTGWCKMCYTSLSLLIVQLLRKTPSCRSLIPLPLAECISLCNTSDNWQRQYICLGVILTSLLHEVNTSVEMDEAVRNTSSFNDSAIASNNQIEKSRPPQVKPNSSGNDGVSTLNRQDSSMNNKNRSQSLDNNSSNSKRSVIGNKTLLSSSTQLGLSANSNSVLPSTRTRSSLRLFSVCDDMVRSGFVRCVIWMLCHSTEVVRGVAAQILHLITLRCQADDEATDINNYSNSNVNSVTTLCDLWACCVEQGLVCQLEKVAAGFEILSADKSSEANLIFPEAHIRQTATHLLATITSKLQAHNSLRSKVLTSMSCSGNLRLKLNVFSGLLYLSGRGHTLGSLLWTTANTPLTSSSTTTSTQDSGVHSSGGVILDLFTALARDVGDLRAFLQVVTHFLGKAVQSIKSVSGTAASATKVKVSNTALEDSPDNPNALLTADLLHAIEPLVLIVDPTTDRTTRMRCPLLGVVERHSEGLAKVIKAALTQQITQALKVDAAILTLTQRADKQRAVSNVVHNLLDDQWFVTLGGSYAVWQEIFSHMADRFILEASVANMSTGDIVSALHTARACGMRDLSIHYGAVLGGKRLAGHTFIQIFQASVGIQPNKQSTPHISYPLEIGGDSESPQLLSLPLCLDCLLYFEKNAEKVINIRKPLETADIVRAQFDWTGTFMDRHPFHRVEVAALNARPNAASDFDTGKTTAVAGNLVTFGQDIGFSSTRCTDGYWPPGPICPTVLTGSTKFSLQPAPETYGTGCFVNGEVGLTVNGATLFSWTDANSYNSAGVWHNLAMSMESNDMDYHHHSYSPCLATVLGDDGTAHSPVHAFAYDGFPVYGPYQAANSLAVSCWQKRNYAASSPTGCSGGKRTCVLKDNSDYTLGTSTASSAGPALTGTLSAGVTYPISLASGIYYEDYFFNATCY